MQTPRMWVNMHMKQLSYGLEMPSRFDSPRRRTPRPPPTPLPPLPTPTHSLFGLLTLNVFEAFPFPSFLGPLRRSLSCFNDYLTSSPLLLHPPFASNYGLRVRRL